MLGIGLLAGVLVPAVIIFKLIDVIVFRTTGDNQTFRPRAIWFSVVMVAGAVLAAGAHPSEMHQTLSKGLTADGGVWPWIVVYCIAMTALVVIALAVETLLKAFGSLVATIRGGH